MIVRHYILVGIANGLALLREYGRENLEFIDAGYVAGLNAGDQVDVPDDHSHLLIHEGNISAFQAAWDQYDPPSDTTAAA